MLALRFREGDYVIIGDAVMKVVRLGEGTVLLGIAAPYDCEILRGKLAERINPELARWAREITTARTPELVPDRGSRR